MGRVWPNPNDPSEPYWLPEDTEDALAYLADLNTRCSGCGHPRDETTAVDGRGWPLHDYAVGSTVCQACEAKAITQDQIAREGGVEAMHGRIFYTYRTDGDDA